MSTSVEALVAAVAVALGGAAGAGLRYVAETWSVARWGTNWPWGTLSVNVLGSLILGAGLGGVLAADLPGWLTLLLGTGFCGALTTFSSFALQILDLSSAASASASAAAGFSPRGLIYAVISVGAGLLAALAVPALIGVLGL